jgi:hypothetical protein
MHIETVSGNQHYVNVYTSSSTMSNRDKYWICECCSKQVESGKTDSKLCSCCIDDQIRWRREREAAKSMLLENTKGASSKQTSEDVRSCNFCHAVIDDVGWTDKLCVDCLAYLW